MPLRFPADLRRCVPLKIAEEESDSEGLIGGAPPALARPEVAGLRFFVSVPFAVDPAERVSVFVAELAQLQSGKLHPLGVVDVVRHAPSGRGPASELDSVLSPMALRLGGEAGDDEPINGELLPRGGHKLGGRPFLFPRTGPLSLEIERLTADGYLHVLQMSFPDRDEPIRGNWPFGDGELHLFGKPPFSRDLWRWCWQH
jgi:hypothetical protein